MTGTQIAYFFLCKRKLWLFANYIVQEHNSDAVALGKQISAGTYKRKKHEILLDNSVIDFFDDKTSTIHEIKKSDKMEESHVWQVKHYINLFKSRGIENVSGCLDYPKLRKTMEVFLEKDDTKKLKEIEREINGIISASQMPEIIDKPFCKKCAYYNFCYV